MRADEMGPEKMGWGRKEERGGGCSPRVQGDRLGVLDTRFLVTGFVNVGEISFLFVFPVLCAGPCRLTVPSCFVALETVNNILPAVPCTRGQPLWRFPCRNVRVSFPSLASSSQLTQHQRHLQSVSVTRIPLFNPYSRPTTTILIYSVHIPVDLQIIHAASSSTW
jgi:hypothetical protein